MRQTLRAGWAAALATALVLQSSPPSFASAWSSTRGGNVLAAASAPTDVLALPAARPHASPALRDRTPLPTTIALRTSVPHALQPTKPHRQRSRARSHVTRARVLPTDDAPPH